MKSSLSHLSFSFFFFYLIPYLYLLILHILQHDPFTIFITLFGSFLPFVFLLCSHSSIFLFYFLFPIYDINLFNVSQMFLPFRSSLYVPPPFDLIIWSAFVFLYLFYSVIIYISLTILYNSAWFLPEYNLD